MSTRHIINMRMTNFLSGLNYKFTLSNIPKTEYLVQRAIIPGITLGTAQRPTPFGRLVEPGEINYSDLAISFKIDSTLESVFEIYDWMEKLGHPLDYDQYEHEVADARLIVLNASMKPILDFTYTDCYPSSISPLTFETTVQDVPYLNCDVTFSFNRIIRNQL